MKRRRAYCPHPAVGWYERPTQFVRNGVRGRVVDVVPRQMVKLCRTHVRKGKRGDVFIDRVDGGRCGWGFNAPPAGCTFIERKRAPARQRRRT